MPGRSDSEIGPSGMRPAAERDCQCHSNTVTVWCGKKCDSRLKPGCGEAVMPPCAMHHQSTVYLHQVFRVGYMPQVYVPHNHSMWWMCAAWKRSCVMSIEVSVTGVTLWTVCFGKAFNAASRWCVHPVLSQHMTGTGATDQPVRPRRGSP